MTRRQNKGYTSPTDLTCGGCKQPIPAGEYYTHDVSKTPWHISCKRIGISGMHHTAPRYISGDGVGEQCDGCGMTIEETDTVVHKATLPWHKECLRL